MKLKLYFMATLCAIGEFIELFYMLSQLTKIEEITFVNVYANCIDEFVFTTGFLIAFLLICKVISDYEIAELKKDLEQQNEHWKQNQAL